MTILCPHCQREIDIGERNTTTGYQDAMLRQAAAEAAALRGLLQVAIDTPWVGSDAHHKRHITAIKIRIRGHLMADYPGNALLAELEAARAVVEAVRTWIDWPAMNDAIRAYDAAAKRGGE